MQFVRFSTFRWTNNDAHTHRQRGASLAEFALTLPLLLLGIVGIMEFGRVAYAYNSITNAAYEGARYASLAPTDLTGIKARVRNSAIALSVNPSDITITCTPCTSGNLIRVDVSYHLKTDVAWVMPDFTLRAAGKMYIQ